MNHLVRLAAAMVVCALGFSLTTAAEMKKYVTIDRTNSQLLKGLFGSYGYQPAQCVLAEADGLRFWLPADVEGVAQTGIYSYFALAGDCEVTLTYELLKLQAPRGGYGSGLGLAFDAGDEVGRGAIQRVHKTAEGNGYVLQCSLVKTRGQLKEEYRFVPAAAERGRIGLRRINKDLDF